MELCIISECVYSKLWSALFICYSKQLMEISITKMTLYIMTKNMGNTVPLLCQHWVIMSDNWRKQQTRYNSWYGTTCYTQVSRGKSPEKRGNWLLLVCVMFRVCLCLLVITGCERLVGCAVCESGRYCDQMSAFCLSA